MFALETIKAKHGDCLLLHWGKSNAKSDRKIALIDGGPDTVYEKFLKPRLKTLAAELGTDKVKFELTMVSHIDDDHINGVLALADDIENGNSAPAKIGLLWHNSLEGLLKQNIDKATAATATASFAGSVPETSDFWYQKVLATVPQGQLLQAFAKRQGIHAKMNAPYQPLVMLSAKQKSTTIAGLSLTVIGPAAKEVEELRKKWKALRDKSITAAFADKSPYNLSSIVVMAKFDDKRMLLTGDARGDLILEGLKAKKLLKNDAIHVDLLKMMHHGSRNNATKDFFKQVTADVYVISGDNKRFPNPHKVAMQWIADARGKDDYVVYCPYELSYMRKIFGKKLRTPKAGEHSVIAKI
jgi:beta-lactamase superfamily II metal-dependent hydrolase